MRFTVKNLHEGISTFLKTFLLLFLKEKYTFYPKNDISKAYAE